MWGNRVCVAVLNHNPCFQCCDSVIKSCFTRLEKSVNNSKQTPILWENCSPPSQAASNPFCGIKGRAAILAAAPGEDSLMLIRSPWVSQALQTLVFKESPVLRVSPITALQWLFLISPVESACSTPVCIPTHTCLAPTLDCFAQRWSWWVYSSGSSDLAGVRWTSKLTHVLLSVICLKAWKSDSGVGQTDFCLHCRS